MTFIKFVIKQLFFSVRYSICVILAEHPTGFGHPVKNPIDATTHRLGVNICSLVRGEKQRETSSIDRSRLQDGRRRETINRNRNICRRRTERSMLWKIYGEQMFRAMRLYDRFRETKVIRFVVRSLKKFKTHRFR